MSEEELKEYDKVRRIRYIPFEDCINDTMKLLDEPDWDIYYWSTGKRSPPERWSNSSILEQLRRHAANEGKVVRRMPDLTGS